jgi:hypothetical protein
MYRQALISIYKSQGEGQYKTIPDKVIIFRQPYHNLGLSMSFSFEKSFAVTVTDCAIEIENVDNTIADALQYDYNKPRTRPKIEIHAGQSDTKITSSSNVEINRLKASLNRVYTGFPIFFSNDKFLNSRILTIDCTDISLLLSSERVTEYYRAGTTLFTMLEDILENSLADLSLLRLDRAFVAIEIEQDVYYYSRFILEEIIPDLENQYGFTHYTNSSGDMVFIYLLDKGTAGSTEQNIISPSTGLIEYPNTVNWIDYECRTFFDKPDIFYPGDRVTLKSPNLSGSTSNNLGTVSGMVTNGQYNFNDSEAEIKYIVNSYGQPFNTRPIKRE